MSIATSLLAIPAAVWVGAIVFQTAVVAPTVFGTLDEAAARQFLRRLFPRFYRLGLVCGALMIAGICAWAALIGVTPAFGLLAIATVAMFVFQAVSLRMVPRINAARDAGDSGRAAFSRLHRMSVLLTVGVLLLGIAVLAGMAMLAAAGAR